MKGGAELLGVIGRLALAFALGLPVGWEREHRAASPGLRTFPLVALGACGFILIGQSAFAGDGRSQAYVFQAVLSGIGFIGGGAILLGKGEILGIATAVCIWITAAVGVAVAYRDYVVAAVLSLVALAALQLLRPLKKHA